ncbi:TetR family transcriptional regulator C-terminal domain-containing protein [Paenibacillus glacialis]
MLTGHLKFYQQLIQQGIDKGEFKDNNAECLSVVFESLTTVSVKCLEN